MTWRLLAVLAGCGLQAGSGPGVRVDQADYVVDWDLAGARLLPEGGWEVTNDRGYTVRVTSGVVVEHTVSLVPCAPEQTSARFDPLGFLPSAWADHAVDEDPSALEAQVRLDLGRPVRRHLGGKRFASTRYCGAHWRVGRADALAEGTAPFRGTSLALSGTWSSAQGQGSFSLQTGWFQGRKHELAEGASWAGGSAVQVTLTHHLAGLVEGLDFARQSDLELVWQLLVNLVEDTDVQIAPRGPA